jgi:hypothetical protein
MENLSNQRIKALLTITVKTILFLTLLTQLSCNKMNEQKFKVFGDESLLKDCKINVSTYRQISYNPTTSLYTSTEELKTVLFNGEFFEIESLEDDNIYTFYFSYKDSLINKRRIENVYYGASDRISHFYISKTDGVIAILFVGREAEIKKKQGFGTFLIPVEDYFKKNKIDNEESRNKEKKLFFDYYK